MNSYELSRKWFDFCFENPEKIKPNHAAMYFFAIEHCNRLGWKKKFGFPSTMVMEAVGIKSYNTYINTLNELVEFGFIEIIERSKNQYSSNIIALSNFNKALNKALDKALVKHTIKQSESNSKSIDSINKQVTSNKKQITITDEIKNFTNSLLIHFPETIIKKLSSSDTNNLFDTIDKLMRLDKFNEEQIKIAVEFARTNDFWQSNFLSLNKLRKKNRDGIKYIDVFLEKSNNKFYGKSKQVHDADDGDFSWPT